MPSGPLGRVILGLATAFGLQPLHANVGSIYIIVKSNDAALVATVARSLSRCCGARSRDRLGRLDRARPHAPSAAAARRRNGRAARFASGDLTPQLDRRRRRGTSSRRWRRPTTARSSRWSGPSPSAIAPTRRCGSSSPTPDTSCARRSPSCKASSRSCAAAASTARRTAIASSTR